MGRDTTRKARDKRIREAAKPAEEPYMPLLENGPEYISDIGSLTGGYYVFNDEEHIALFSDTSLERMSPAEKSALSDYTAFGYAAMNGELDRGNPDAIFEMAASVSYTNLSDLPSEVRSNVKLFVIQQMLSRNIVSKNMLTRRSETNRSPIYSQLVSGALEVGDVISRGGFMSTTISAKYELNTYKRIEYEIKVPKGTKGMYIGHLSQMHTEYEFLFPSRTRFRVTKITKTGEEYDSDTERFEPTYKLEVTVEK